MTATSISTQAISIDVAATALMSVLDPAGYEDVARVSPTQLRTLMLVAVRPATNVNGLAEFLGVNPSSASRLCDRLEALGLLDRRPDDKDRREVKIALTAQARELLDTLAEHRRRALAEVLNAMSESARRDLERSLAAFAEALAQQVAPPQVDRRIA